MPLLFRTQLIIMEQAHSRRITDASHSWVFVRPMRLASTYEVNNADWIRMGCIGCEWPVSYYSEQRNEVIVHMANILGGVPNDVTHDNISPIGKPFGFHQFGVCGLPHVHVNIIHWTLPQWRMNIPAVSYALVQTSVVFTSLIVVFICQYLACDHCYDWIK